MTKEKCYKNGCGNIFPDRRDILRRKEDRYMRSSIPTIVWVSILVGIGCYIIGLFHGTFWHSYFTKLL